MRLSPRLASLSLLVSIACGDSAEPTNPTDQAGSPSSSDDPMGSGAGLGGAGTSKDNADGPGPGEGDAAAPVGNLLDDEGTPGHDVNGIVSCGPKSPACDLASQACCVTGFGAEATNCEEGTVCAEGNPTPCDGPEECGAGEACCVLPAEGTTVCKVGCRETPGAFEVTLCHVDADCPAGEACTQSLVLPWWGTCN
jgi:hypothetical protein